MAKKKKPESMLARQRRLLREQRAKKAAKSTKGKGALVKRSDNRPASQRVEKVKVKVDPPKQLPSAKTKALPKGKTQPKGKVSARRAQAAAKAARAAKGTKGGTRVGQPKGAANRYYGADRVDAAVKRAQASTGKGKLAGTVQALMAQGVGFELASKLAETIGKPGQSRMSRLGIQGPAKPKSAKPKPAEPKSTTKAERPKVKRNRRGRPVTKSTKRGMSNIPPKEGTGKGSPTDKKPTLKPAGKVAAPAPSRKPAPTKPKSLKSAAYAKEARNKEYDRLRKAGKIKEAEELGKLIAADARKKAPKNPFRKPEGKERKDRFSKDVAELKGLVQKKRKKLTQSAAIKAGYPGNRNY